jgi:hypothetical protein
MTEKEYNICIGKILAGVPLTSEEGQRFVEVLCNFESLLDQGDQDDYFGTEGWRHRVDWD